MLLNNNRLPYGMSIEVEASTDDTATLSELSGDVP